MAVPDGENKRSPLKAWMRALERTAAIDRGRAPALPVLIGELGARFGDAPALSSPQQSLSYRALAAAVSRCARWGLAQGLKRGDVAGLFMENCPEYLVIWLGLTRIGVTVALINSHLTSQALAHSVNTVRPRLLICDGELAPALLATRAHSAPGAPCWLVGPGPPELPRLDLALATLDEEPLSEAECAAPQLSERALCIYTSGTTGLPKAANVSHYRVLQWSHWFAGLMDVTPRDRMYDCLPLYHSVGGVVATGATLVAGGSVVLRRRFSASTFWADVIAERCTLFQYIGELCRYLLNAPARPEESRHGLRLACGNGLRAEVWLPFQERFRIPQILEYYAATEGNFSLYNCEGRPGAVGRIPPFLAHRVPVALVKFDAASALPQRAADGRCVRCAVGESGEALGQILPGQGGTRFEGYTDAAATGGKVLHDVFAPGDTWYRTGDLMRQDERGFYYFVDRLGDTFRWKGENVATAEVSAVLASCAGVSDAAVYGVPVPGSDGRAGMAAVVVGADF
ncbi:MAG TPA: AMP-binding protein, partial [Steroidobacteraceae bacterium]|nr:AMP-binding protein [Steroidobacteraceae bacterium]